MSFKFEKGFAATDFEQVAKKQHIEPVEVSQTRATSRVADAGVVVDGL